MEINQVDTKVYLGATIWLDHGSVRYDARIPGDVRERLLEIANICNLVADFFPGEPTKVQLWFITPNPQFGDIPPRDMIRHGRYAKLLNYVMAARNAQLG